MDSPHQARDDRPSSASAGITSAVSATPTTLADGSVSGGKIVPFNPVGYSASGGAVIIETGDGQSAYRHPAVTLSEPNVLIAPQTPMPTSTGPTSTATAGASSGNQHIPSGALFAAIFFPILLIAGVILGTILCIRRRRRRAAQLAEGSRAYSPTAIERSSRPGVGSRKIPMTSTTYYNGVAASAAAANNFSRPSIAVSRAATTRTVDVPPPSYSGSRSVNLAPHAASPVARLNDPSPRLPSPSLHAQPSPLSEANMAAHRDQVTGSPFDHPDDDAVSEISDVGRARVTSKDFDAVSIVSGMSTTDERAARDPHQVL